MQETNRWEAKRREQEGDQVEMVGPRGQRLIDGRPKEDKVRVRGDDDQNAKRWQA